MKKQDRWTTCYEPEPAETLRECTRYAPPGMADEGVTQSFWTAPLALDARHDYNWTKAESPTA